MKVFFFRFCPKADKTYFLRDDKKEKNQVEKTTLEKTANLVHLIICFILDIIFLNLILKQAAGCHKHLVINGQLQRSCQSNVPVNMLSGKLSETLEKITQNKLLLTVPEFYRGGQMLDSLVKYFTVQEK